MRMCDRCGNGDTGHAGDTQVDAFALSCSVGMLEDNGCPETLIAGEPGEFDLCEKCLSAIIEFLTTPEQRSVTVDVAGRKVVGNG